MGKLRVRLCCPQPRWDLHTLGSPWFPNRSRPHSGTELSRSLLRQPLNPSERRGYRERGQLLSNGDWDYEHKPRPVEDPDFSWLFASTREVRAGDPGARSHRGLYTNRHHRHYVRLPPRLHKRNVRHVSNSWRWLSI